MYVYVYTYVYNVCGCVYIYNSSYVATKPDAAP